MQLAVTYVYDDSEYGREWDQTEIWNEKKIRELLVRDHLMVEGAALPAENEVMELLLELRGDIIVNVESIADFQKRAQEKERQVLESLAASMARTHNVAVNSVEFLELLDNEIERLESYRDGMREDGLCIGNGVSYLDWLEEHNASVSDTMKIRELRSWMKENLPLLCARYEEQKAIS